MSVLSAYILQKYVRNFFFFEEFYFIDKGQSKTNLSKTTSDAQRNLETLPDKA